MPITDLLNQISGSKSTGSPTPDIQRSISAPIKRKANDDLPSAAAKTPRLLAPPVNYPPRQTNGLSAKSTSQSSAPLNNGSRSARTAIVSKAPQPRVDAAKPKAPPKKGSYAEILARAQRAQAVMGQVGKIQHKKAEKGAIKKDKDRSEVRARPTGPSAKRSTGYAGTSKPVQRNGTNGTSSSKFDRNGTALKGKPAPGARKVPAPEPEKKIKKAVSATTGYTGTARPKPGNPSKKNHAPRGGALLNVPAPRSNSSRRSKYEDDYDEDMEDFIDYDDEADDDGPRYGYASDGSSDMEAGLDDIDDEERLAERIARREDLEEERLEKSLKTAKEEKKRKALEELRASKRR